MKNLFIAAILGLVCTVSAFADSHDVPTAQACVSVGPGPYSYSLSNICAQSIEVHIAFADGESDLEEVAGGSTTNFGNGHEGYRYFACYQPAYATVNPDGVARPSYTSNTFWCRNNFN